LEHLFCVIMAGGKGERFWPLSTAERPKPFVKLLDDTSPIQATCERALRLAPAERVFVVLGRKHLAVAREQLPHLPVQNFIVEPSGRNTAPCIGLAALLLSRIDIRALMVVLPADHHVPDADAFVRTMQSAAIVAEQRPYLVTLGMKPARAETGYGYIKVSRRLRGFGSTVCYRAERFVEKPDLETAETYLRDSRYYWNGGIFLWQTSVVLEGIRLHMPDLHTGLMGIGNLLGDRAQGRTARSAIGPVITRIFNGLKGESIDYGLMEKAKNVVMVPAEFTWDDLGSWTSVARVSGVDERGNWRKGRTVCIDTEGSVIVGEEIPVGVIGLKGVVIVASKKGVLVCAASRVQDVREIAGTMEPGDPSG
jgi:mannose-1-phosphate guanylyltransferase